MTTAYRLRRAKKQPLKAEVLNGRLVVSIGIDTLAFAAQGRYDEEAFKEGRDAPEFSVSDNRKFAKSVLAALEREEEDGTQLPHIMLDDAFDYVLEQGLEGISETPGKGDSRG